MVGYFTQLCSTFHQTANTEFGWWRTRLSSKWENQRERERGEKGILQKIEIRKFKGGKRENCVERITAEKNKI